MKLNQDKIQRMFNGQGSVAGGGGSSFDPSLLFGLATEQWTEENYVSKTFFNELFVIHKLTTTVVYDENDQEISRTTSKLGTFLPNELPSETETVDEETGHKTVVTTAVDNIEAKKGVWTNFFMSALGLNDAGGGGGVGDVTWDALEDDTDYRQIALSHLTTALQNYATQTWVQTQGYVTQSAISDMATKTWVGQQGFLTSSAISDMATKTWVGQQGYLTSSAISDMATKTWVGQQGFITSVTGTFWGRTFTNGGTVTGTLESVQHIQMTGHLYMHYGGTGIYLNSDGTGIDWHDANNDYMSSLLAFTSWQVQFQQDAYIPASKILRLGDAVFEWDATNNAVKVRKATGANDAVNFYATGGVSALGYGPSGGGGTGDVTWELLADNTDTRQIALSHLTTALSGYATQNWVQGAYLPLTGGTLTGDLRIRHNSDNQKLQFYTKDGTSLAGYLSWTENTLGNYLELYNPITRCGFYMLDYNTSAPFYTNDGGSNLYTIWHSGNDGTGSGLDADLLDGQHGSYYATASSLSNYLPLSGGTFSGNDTISIDSNGNFKLNSKSGTYWHIDTYDDSKNLITATVSGNVGIGTKSPSYKLHVNGTFYANGNSSVSGTLSASSFIKNGGTSSQFLKADGSVDENSYALASSLASYLPLTGGVLTGAVYMKENADIQKFQFYKKDGTSLAGYLAWTENTNAGYLELYNPISGRGIWLRTDVPEAPIYYLGSSSSLTNKIIHEAIIDNYIGQYYWANVKVSKTSSTTTTPTFYGIGFSSSGHFSIDSYGNFHATTNTDSNFWNVYNYAGVNSLSVLASSGYVGIGTTVPSERLEVNGNIKSNIIYANSSNSGIPPIIPKNAGASGPLIFNGEASNLSDGSYTALLFGYADSTNNKGSLLFNKVGVGSTSNYVGIGFYGNDNILNITANKSVGIGTASPSQKLDVNGHSHFGGSLYIDSVATGNYNEGIRVANTKDSSYCTICLGVDPSVLVGTHANQWQIGRDSSNHFFWNCGGSVLMRLFQTGQLGIGTQSPEQKLHVLGNILVCGSSYTANGHYVQIGAIRLVYNDSTNSIRVVRYDGTAANLYATGGISALGISSGADGTVNASLIPSTTGTYELGSSSYGWKKIYLSYNSSNSYTGTISVDGDGINLISSNGGYLSGTRFLVNGRLVVNESDDLYPSYALYVNGNTYCDGTISASNVINRSDMRLKDVLDDLKLDLQTIANAPLFKFTFRKGERRVMVGTSAQYWQVLLPESVFADADGMLGLDYGVTALASAISLAREVSDHDRRIAALEAENMVLRAEIKNLKAA